MAVINMQNILASLTLDDAESYDQSAEKYTFCIDYLGISAHDDNADTLVEKLENKFDKLLRQSDSY